MKIQIKNEFNKINVDGIKYQNVEILSSFENSGLNEKKINFIKNKFFKLINGENKGTNKFFYEKIRNIRHKDYALAQFGYRLGRPKDIKNCCKTKSTLFFTCKLYN